MVKQLDLKFCLVILLTTIFKSSPQKIAAKKCEEYAEAVFVNEISPVLTRRTRVNRVSHCGIVEVPLIVGGVATKPKEFPHMALLGFGDHPNSELTWECGGSLISEQFILSAAHCQINRMRQPVQKVRLGIIDIKSEDDMQERVIIQRFKHPKYDFSSKINDIALFKMDSPVAFTPYVRPACLNLGKILPGSRFIATGFGKVDYHRKVGSQSLMKVDLFIYNKTICEKVFRVKQKFSRLRKGVLNSMICGGFYEGGKDTCQGDSGGPIQTVLSKPYCMYAILGITSFGIGCGMSNTAAIYTRVSSYVPWIEKIVWGK